MTAGIMLAVALGAGVAGCSLMHREPPRNALAIVGEQWITYADVLKTLQTSGVDSVSERDIILYVNHWVDTQLLLYEARKMNLQNDPEIRRQLADLEQELLINQLLKTNTEVDTPGSQQIVDYWKVHTGEYTRVANEVSVVIARVPSSNQGWKVHEGYDQSLSAEQMREEIGVTRIDTLEYVSESRLPKPIAAAFAMLKTGQSSTPVEYHGEWLVIKVLDRYRAGRPRGIEEVKTLVMARMMAEDRSRRKQDYIEALRREARQSGLVRIRFDEPAVDTLSGGGSTHGSAVVDTPASALPSQREEDQ